MTAVTLQSRISHRCSIGLSTGDCEGYNTLFKYFFILIKPSCESSCPRHVHPFIYDGLHNSFRTGYLHKLFLWRAFWYYTATWSIKLNVSCRYNTCACCLLACIFKLAIFYSGLTVLLFIIVSQLYLIQVKYWSYDIWRSLFF